MYLDVPTTAGTFAFLHSDAEVCPGMEGRRSPLAWRGLAPAQTGRSHLNPTNVSSKRLTLPFGPGIALAAPRERTQTSWKPWQGAEPDQRQAPVRAACHPPVPGAQPQLSPAPRTGALYLSLAVFGADLHR